MISLIQNLSDTDIYLKMVARKFDDGCTNTPGSLVIPQQSNARYRVNIGEKVHQQTKATITDPAWK